MILHDVTLYPAAAGASIDAEGRTTTRLGTARTYPATRVLNVAGAESKGGDQLGERFDVIWHAPLGDAVKATDEIELGDGAGPLAGRFLVVAVQHVVLHLRVFARRLEP